ncbi:hypothetical protein C9I99_26855 [Photobacterium lutimaris]|uniref:DUF3313 domain-containing protein n=1 Tax=Photobacterium lutimaris TaxID=388278 RepID=A0A2T3IGN0_9GAMM|nr:hypothetical protein [Photobacterium lutimaris]PSU26130.1 hypothetical protein C9I99_26855 [Photobacterium lutimaris]
MNKVVSILSLSLILGACASTSPKTEVTGISVKLPQDNWVQVTNKEETDQYIKEWVPNGKTPFDTNWIITEQKLPIQSKTSAENFQKSMFSLAKQSCTDVLYNGPQEINVNDHLTSVGRIMCAKQNGKSYGTFTDQRVVIQGLTAYVVTSELRIPASSKAGVLAFDKEQLNEMKEFMQLQGKSSSFVRKSVNVCLSDSVNCI